jgi:hypothetical protein
MPYLPLFHAPGRHRKSPLLSPPRTSHTATAVILPKRFRSVTGSYVTGSYQHGFRCPGTAVPLDPTRLRPGRNFRYRGTARRRNDPIGPACTRGERLSDVLCPPATGWPLAIASTSPSGLYHHFRRAKPDQPQTCEASIRKARGVHSQRCAGRDREMGIDSCRPNRI